MGVKISIVTVCFNSEKTIQKTIDSIAAQNYPNFEWIVVDGGSKDATLKLLEPANSLISKVVSEPDRGIYDAMNKGWQFASGDVVGFLNSDDAYASCDVLAQIAEAFEEPGTEAVYGDLQMVDQAGHLVRNWRAGEFSRSKYKWGWMTPHPTTYIRKHHFERSGGFKLRYSISADYELMLRLFVKEGVTPRYVQKVLVRMLAGGTSNASLSAILKGNWQVYRSYAENQLFMLPTVALFKPLSKLRQLRDGRS